MHALNYFIGRTTNCGCSAMSLIMGKLYFILCGIIHMCSLYIIDGHRPLNVDVLEIVHLRP